MGDTNARLGDGEAAIRWYQRAYASHSSGIAFLPVRKEMAPYRNVPRIKAIIAHVKVREGGEPRRRPRAAVRSLDAPRIRA